MKPVTYTKQDTISADRDAIVRKIADLRDKIARDRLKMERLICEARLLDVPHGRIQAAAGEIIQD